MNNSPTEGEQASTGLPEQPTGQEQAQQTSAEQSNQETNSGANTQGSVSDDTANSQQVAEQKQTEQTGGESQTDDGLANFAKSQGFDLETAGDDVKRALKIAHDNQKAFRERNSGERITDASKNLQAGEPNLERRVAEMEYERYTDRFWGEQGRDRSMESTMVGILNEKVEELTPMLGKKEAEKYAFSLSRDLNTLYGMAQLKNGAQAGASVDADAIRREERESINKQMSAGAPNAHATQTGASSTQKVTDEWIRNEYDPRNPEHIKMMQEAGLR